MAGFSIHGYLGCRDKSSIYVVIIKASRESTIRGSEKGAMEGGETSC